MRHPFALALVGLLFIPGCWDDVTKKSPNSIIGKTTQDVGKYDPNAKQQVSDSKVRATDPFTAPLAAYNPILEQATKAQITHAINLFEATNARYPKDYDEFMEKIIKENNIRLPQLAYGFKYQYDEAKHELVVVKPEGSPNGPGLPPAGK